MSRKPRQPEKKEADDGTSENPSANPAETLNPSGDAPNPSGDAPADEPGTEPAVDDIPNIADSTEPEAEQPKAEEPKAEEPKANEPEPEPPAPAPSDAPADEPGTEPAAPLAVVSEAPVDWAKEVERIADEYQVAVEERKQVSRELDQKVSLLRTRLNQAQRRRAAAGQ
jgi:hypothetical protein